MFLIRVSRNGPDDVFISLSREIASLEKDINFYLSTNLFRETIYVRIDRQLSMSVRMDMTKPY